MLDEQKGKSLRCFVLHNNGLHLQHQKLAIPKVKRKMTMVFLGEDHSGSLK